MSDSEFIGILDKLEDILEPAAGNARVDEALELIADTMDELERDEEDEDDEEVCEEEDDEDEREYEPEEAEMYE